jgi:hypothetical protein
MKIYKSLQDCFKSESLTCEEKRELVKKLAILKNGIMIIVDEFNLI